SSPSSSSDRTAAPRPPRARAASAPGWPGTTAGSRRPPSGSARRARTWWHRTRSRYHRLMLRCSLVVLALAAGAVAAAPPPAPKIQGTFGFDVMKSERTKCAKVTGALFTRLGKDYRCAPPDGDGKGGSGVPIVASCKAKKGQSAYLLFATPLDCETERATQA